MSEKLSIESDAISFTSAEDGTFILTMRTAAGRYVTVTNEGQSKDPVIEGDTELAQSPAIVKALWLAAVAQQDVNELVLQKEKDPTKTATKEYKRKLKKRVKEAKGAARMATALAELVYSLDGTEVEGWCSQCFSKAKHQKVSGKPLYLCASCGAATMKCSAIGCKHLRRPISGRCRSRCSAQNMLIACQILNALISESRTLRSGGSFGNLKRCT